MAWRQPHHPSSRGQPQAGPEFEQFSLTKAANGAVELRFKDDEDDYLWYVLRIEPDGTLTRFGSLVRNAGFQPDKHGCILLSNKGV